MMSRQRGRQLLLVALVVAQLVWAEIHAYRGHWSTVWIVGRTSAALFVAAILGAALVVLLLGDRVRPRALRWLVLGIALLFTVRFHAVRALNTREQKRFAASMLPVNKPTSVLLSFLREMEAVQEQFRLHHHTYAESLDSLRPFLSSVPAVTNFTLVAHADSGWTARASLEGATCSLWVRDSSLRAEAWEPEGAPVCGEAHRAKHRQLVTVLAAPGTHEIGFRAQDLGGTWLQQRANFQRTGIVMNANGDQGAHRWTTRIGGAMVASVAVAGNQVFAGAHGNGELDALTLDSGKVGFRIRVPNWIHHEPVVTSDLVIVGFGNNEPGQLPFPAIGSDPSGVAAYDRRTGVERWHHYTSGAVMTSPLIRDSLVVAMNAVKEAIAWRVNDGVEVWRTPLPGIVPMGNPLLLDSLVVIGLEAATLCAIDVRSGKRLYCRREANLHGWGGGHTTVASDGTVLLHVFDQGVSTADRVRAGRWRDALVSLFRLPGLSTIGEQALIAADPPTGRELWRVKLGVGDNDAEGGHIAGTPAVVGGVAYVPSPISGRVYAVKIDAGRVLWWTDVHTARGSVLVTQGAVLAATRDTTLVVLDAVTGKERCHERLPGLSDRAGPTLAGQTAIMTFRNGIVAARPIADWLACRA